MNQSLKVSQTAKAERSINESTSCEKLHNQRTKRLSFFFKRFSIDAAPQLLNVLKGDMALFGPQALQPSECLEDAGELWDQLAVKPGITCLARSSKHTKSAFEA